MAHGERAEKRNRKMDHDWHERRKGMTGRRLDNRPYDYRPRSDKMLTRRKERRRGQREIAPPRASGEER